jgi:hypothetical protein
MAGAMALPRVAGIALDLFQVGHPVVYSYRCSNKGI